MPVDLLKNITKTAPTDTALLGMDVGKKTIGLALGYVEQGIATPLHTIKRTKFTHDIEALAKVIAEHDIGGFVIGLPVNMDGSEGPRAQSIRDFARELERQLPNVIESSHTFISAAHAVRLNGGDPKKDSRAAADKSNIWIALWDERLSTVSVEDIVDKYVDKRKTKTQSKSSGLIDKLAAQIILQGAIDYLQ